MDQRNVFDPSLRRVESLIEGTLGSGTHTVFWDGRNAKGGQAATGVYWLRLQGETSSMKTKIVLVR